MSDEPDWAKVLSVIYEQGGYIDSYPIGAGTPPDTHKLVRRSGLSPLAVDMAVLVMREARLAVVPERAEGYPFELITEVRGVDLALTQRGFEVAHERELTKRQDRTNTTLVVFTLALVLATLVEVLPPELQVLGYDFNLRIVGAIALLEVLVAYILHTDLHEELLDL